jgi:uncharacterized Zn finger protein
VLLWEKNTQAAWQAAQAGGCTEELWLQLARQRAQQHPHDAVPVLRRHIEAAIALTNRDGYEQAVALLPELGECYQRMNTPQEFTEYVAQLRANHRRKRNFITALDTARLPH